MERVSLNTQDDQDVPEMAERALMVAILKRAVDDWNGVDMRGNESTSEASQRIKEEVREWFLDESEDYLYSFENICAALAIPAKAIRTALQITPAKSKNFKNRGGSAAVNGNGRVSGGE